MRLESSVLSRTSTAATLESMSSGWRVPGSARCHRPGARARQASDGTSVAPGEVFSANAILASLDYNDAKVIIDGKVESAELVGSVDEVPEMAVLDGGIKRAEE
jgi:hypothetical protein